MIKANSYYSIACNEFWHYSKTIIMMQDIRGIILLL